MNPKSNIYTIIVTRLTTHPRLLNVWIKHCGWDRITVIISTALSPPFYFWQGFEYRVNRNAESHSCIIFVYFLKVMYFLKLLLNL
jgi:hypothetical protein